MNLEEFHAIYQEICCRFEKSPSKTVLIWKNYLSVLIRKRNKKHITEEEVNEIEEFLFGMISYYEGLFDSDPKFFKCRESVSIFTSLMYDYLKHY